MSWLANFHAIVLFLLVISCRTNSFVFAQDVSEAATAIVQHAVTEPASRPFTFDRTVFQHDTRDLPIGVFDSGIGGLTVLEAILALDSFNNQTLEPKPDGLGDFKDEKFVYLGDQANMPYGNYAAVGKLDYLRELILKDAIFLLGQRYWKDPLAPEPLLNKPPVKAIAIGCNTATAYGLEDIKAAVKEWGIPIFIVGVVEAGARGVLELPKERLPSDSCVAVLATVGTCNSGAYPRAIRSTLGLAGRQIPSIIQQGFVELAAAIEGDPQAIVKGSANEFIRRDLLQLVDEHQKSGDSRPIGTIILGCTHFPLVESEIVETLLGLRGLEQNGQRPYAKLIAEKIEVVNPAQLTAKELFRSLAQAKLRSTKRLSAADSRVQYFISVPNPASPGIQLTTSGGLDHDYKYGRTAQQFTIEDTRVVPMVAELLPASSLNLMQNRLPQVWQSFQGTANR